MKKYALILAGGSGKRIQRTTAKAFLTINNLLLFEYSLLQFISTKEIDAIILVVPEEYLSVSKKLIHKKKYSKVTKVLVGGASRFESSFIGLSSIEETDAQVLIHDAARPFINNTTINNCIKALDKYDAVNILSPINDSIVEIKGQHIIGVADRTKFRQVQTPQGFTLTAIKKAQNLAIRDKLENITDDFNLVLKYKTGTSTWIEGSRNNIKITYPDDIILAKKTL